MDDRYDLAESNLRELIGGGLPRVSVIIPTYNRKRYVIQAIDSVFAQSYIDYEIIVIDDGSADGTGEALRGRFGDKIRYMWQENQGESSARNRGIEVAQGDYIALLDSDDVWLPQKLEQQVLVLDANTSAVLVFCPAWPVNAEGRQIGDRPTSSGLSVDELTLEALCHENVMGNSTVLVRRKTLREVGGFDETIRYSEDWDMWIRLRQKGPFAYVDEPLAYLRRHEGSQSHALQPEKLDEILASQLHILKKAFSSWQGDIPRDFPNRMLAHRYAQIALLDYLIGRAELGQEHLARAKLLDPQYQISTNELSDYLVHGSVHQTTVSGMHVQVAHKNLMEALDHWPTDLGLSCAQKTRILGKLYANYLFATYIDGDLDLARYCWPKAILFDPSCRRNLGVWSIGAEIFLGNRPARYLRKIGKKLLGTQAEDTG